jgi:polysaccharide deacetylase family protein (PEP-CTERM system associated)
MTAHCFTVDVEGFCESMAESLALSHGAAYAAEEKAEIADNTAEILDFLAECGVKGTFFVLGRIAEEMPDVVKRIATAGHEIGSHSFRHVRLWNLSREQAKEAISRSKKALEDAAGMAVAGFRAPDFSIRADSLFLLDFLRDAGYRYDSSLYPIRGHDVYGAPDTPRWFHRMSNGLVECPLSVFQAVGMRLPALGGGYFRLYPLMLTRAILLSIERRGHPAVCYIHPYELGSCCPMLPGLSFCRKFRHYVNRTKTRKRFKRLIAEFAFGRMDDAIRAGGIWE